MPGAAIAAAILVSSPFACADPVGYLSVRCGGEPLRVTLDGEPAGVCPLDSVPVSPGSHTVQAWPADDRRFTATPLTRRVEVLTGALTVVDFSVIRRVRIESEPYGAMISREGVPLGSTPLTLSVSPDDPQCLIEMEGFQSVTVTAESLIEGPSPLRLTLEPIPGVSRTAVLSRRGPSEPERSHLTAYLAGTICAGAITAALFLSEAADAEYEEYLITGDLSEMERHFDRAERLDSWAAASWVVGEVALGILAYEILRDRDGGAEVKEGGE